MKLFRKRYFPNETVELNDEIVFWNEQKLVTKWKAIRPKPDLSHGISCFFIEDGIKISKFYRADGSLLYWYCDIGECIINKKEFVFEDLLADVIIYPNGEVRVVDLDEAADIYEEGRFSAENICKMLRRLNSLLGKVYSGEFKEMQQELEKFE